MLGRARGALACIGHVDRAWGSSFLQADPRHHGAVTAQLAVFESTLKRLMEGRRVGHAMDYFDLRYAELASDLATRIEDATKYDIAVDDRELVQLWLHANDARDYAVIGDPAVRIGARSTAAEAFTQPEGATDIHSNADGKPGVLAELARSTIHTLRRAVSDVLSLEVTTYAGEFDSARAAAAGDANGHVRPKAYTCCKIDGATISSVPVDEHGAVNVELWRIHEAALTQARQQRDDTLKLILSLLPGVGT
jgi:hypothetical protein